MRFLAMLAALTLALITVAQPAHAQIEAKIAARNADRVTLVFAPPLDTNLRFRISLTKTSDDEGQRSVSWIEEVRFVRNGNGFILYWRMDPASLPSATRQRSLAPMTRATTSEPIAFDLDSMGTVLRVRDWDVVRPRLANLPADAATLFAGSFDKPSEQGEVAAQLATLFNRMSAEEAAQLILKNLGVTLGWGELTMGVGEVIEETYEQPIPMFDTTVKMTTSQTLVSVDPGRTAVITMRSGVDRDALAKTLSDVMGAAGLADQSPEGQRRRREVERMRHLSLTDTTRILFDLPTGLTLSYRNERRVEVDGTWRVSILLIEWLR